MTSDAGQSFDPYSRIYPDATLRRAYARDSGHHWYVLRTKPRQETRAQLNLKAWGLQTLLPRHCIQRRCRHGHSVEHHHNEPVHALFPSYMFCRFPETMFDKVKYTYGVAHVVSFGGVPAVVDQVIIDELAARLDPDGFIQETLQGRPFLQQHADNLRNGDKVLIESGPFKNLIGVFEKNLPGSDRVRILLDAVKFQSRVECSRGDVRPLHGESK